LRIEKGSRVRETPPTYITPDRTPGGPRSHIMAS
jgi:hypothetical protein